MAGYCLLELSPMFLVRETNAGDDHSLKRNAFSSVEIYGSVRIEPPRENVKAKFSIVNVIYNSMYYYFDVKE